MLLFDDDLPGFGLRVRAGGKRTWIAQYRLGLKQRRITLGNVTAVSPDEARRRAKIALGKVSLGIDPQAEKRALVQQAAITLDAAVPGYLAYAASRQKSRHRLSTKRYLERQWAPIAETSLNQISRGIVAARLLEIAEKHGPISANRARAALSSFFSWAIGAGLAVSNPVTGTHKAAEEIARSRVLSDDELCFAWHNAGSGDFKDILRLLILTGQRREEVGGMLWHEIKDDVWEIGSARAKNGMSHQIPLSRQAAVILAARPKVAGRNFIFGACEGPFQGWSSAKAKLDAAMLTAWRTQLKKDQILPWRLHDIRRTAATRMGDLGVPPYVVESLLNHVSGFRAGVAGVYNHSRYTEEKKEALALWAAHVERVTQR